MTFSLGQAVLPGQTRRAGQRLAAALACVVAAGCSAAKSPGFAQVERPIVAPAEPCEAVLEDARAAEVVAAHPPELQGTVELLAARGDDRLRPGEAYFQAKWTDDGKHLITASATALIVWDPILGEPRWQVPLALPGNIRAMAIAGDGMRVALSIVASHEQQWVSPTVVIVRPREGVVRILDEVSAERLRFSGDGARLIGGTRMWDLASGQRLWGARSFSGAARADFNGLTISKIGSPGDRRSYSQWFNDGRGGVEVLANGAMLTLQRWRPLERERTVIATLRRTESSRYALSPNGHFFVAVRDGQARRWSLLDGKLDRFEVPGDVEALAISNDGQSLAHWKYLRMLPGGTATATSPLSQLDNRVRLWSFPEARERWTLPADGSQFIFSPDDTLLMADPVQSLTRVVIDVATGGRTEGQGRVLAVHAASRRAYVEPRYQRPRIIELQGAAQWPKRNGGHEQVVRRAANGNMATVDEDGRYRVRGAGRCLLLPAELAHVRDPDPVKFANGGTLLLADMAVGHDRRRIAAWELSGGKVQGSVEVGLSAAQRTCVLPDSGELMLVQGDHLRFTSLYAAVGSQRQWRTRIAPAGKLMFPRWCKTTPDQEVLLPHRADGAYQLSRMNKGGGRLRPQFSSRSLQSYAASPDGRIVAAAMGNSLRWSVKGHAGHHDTLDFGERLQQLSFAPDNRTVAVTSRTGHVYLADVVDKKEVAMVDLRSRYDGARLITWTGPRTLTIDTERGAEFVVRRTASVGQR